MIAMGVAMPRAQGQEITSTLTAAIIPAAGLPVNIVQPMKVRRAVATTAGTKTAATLSASFCMGALKRWASSTAAIMRARAVSPVSAVTLILSEPS